MRLGYKYSTNRLVIERSLHTLDGRERNRTMTFVNRKREIEILRSRLRLLIGGPWDNTSHLAILGLRRTGKTFLIRHFLDETIAKADVCVQYVDVSKIANSPRDFAKNYVRSALAAWTQRESDDLLELALETENRRVIERVSQFQSRIVVDGSNADIVRFAFDIHALLSDRKFVVTLDEFQEILALERFPDIANVDALLRASLQSLDHVLFILCGSYPTLLGNWLRSPDRFLFGHFSVVSVGEFCKADTYALADAIADDLTRRDRSDIYRYSCGNPYLATILARQKQLSGQAVADIFKGEVFRSTGSLYSYFEYLFHDSLSKVPGGGIMREVAKQLALAGTALTAPEVARRINKSTEEVHTALRGLAEIDLIYEHERQYHFRSLPFRFFLAYRYMGLEQYEYAKSHYYEQKLRELNERFCRVSEELGHSKEFELLHQIREHQGQSLWGTRIPHFKQLQKGVECQGGEVDVLGATRRGKLWAFELKWTQKRVGEKEIERFLSKLEAHRYVYVSRMGFTEGARSRYAAEKHICLVQPPA